MKLPGSTFLVTGGASGLGRATVLNLVRRGANAVIVDLKEEDAQSIIQEVGDKSVLWPGKTDITSEGEYYYYYYH